MKNRLFSIFLSIILCIGLFPTTALADTTMIYIGGVMLQSGNYLASGSDAQTDEKPSGGYAYLEYENGEATLTLNNFVYTGDSGYEDAMIDTAEGMLIINLIGKNALTDTGYTDNIDTGFKYGILNEMSDSVTRITGDGCLDIKSYRDGISASNVELQSGTINIESYENCIDAGSDVEISGGSLTITSEGGNGIVAGDTVKIDQALVSIDADEYGIYAKGEDNDIAVSLSNATVNIKATDRGLYTTKDDGCVSVTGCILTYDGYDSAIYTKEKKAHISISDSILKLKTQSDHDPILDVKNSKSDIDIKNSILLFESQYGFDEEDNDDVDIESALINHNGDITIYTENQYTLPEELILEIDPNKDMSVVEGEDTLTVTGQSLTLNGGNIQMKGKIINNSTITVDEGAIVTVTGEVANNGKINNNGTINVTREVTNNGKINNNGTINIETIDLLKGTGEIEGDGLFQITSFFPSEIEIDGNWIYNGTDQAVAVKDAVKVPATITLQGQEFTYPQIDASKIKIEPAVVKDAGNYTVSFINGGGSKEFSVAPAEIVIDTVIVAEKTYNGKKDAEISSVMFKTVDGTNIFDTVEKGTDYNAEGVFDSENVGENIPVSVTVEWKNPNYTLQETTAESTGTIVPKSLTPVIIVKENVIYGVNSLSPDIQVMDGEDEIDAKEYTVSYSNNEKVGTATVSVTDVNGGNYVLGSVSQYYTINKADIDLSIDFSPVAQKANKDVTVIVTAKNKDTNKDADGWMQPTEVSLTAPESMREKTPFTQTDSTKGIWEAVYTVNHDAPLGKVDFTAAVADTTGNYNLPQNVTGQMEIIDKGTVNVSLVADKTDDVVYGDAIIYSVQVTKVNDKDPDLLSGYVDFYLDPTDTSSMEQIQNTGTLLLRLVSMDGAAKLDHRVLSVGNHSIYAVYSGNDGFYPGYAVVNTEVGKATITITAEDKSTYIGYDMPQLTYTVNGFVGTDTLTKEPKLSCRANMNRKGTYTISAMDAEADESKYTIVYVDGKLQVDPKPSPSSHSSKPSYASDVTDSTNGNTVVAPEKAKSGETVTITTNPAEGYFVAKVKVTDERGFAVSVIHQGNGIYTFKQPIGKVNVDVTYQDVQQRYIQMTINQKDIWVFDKIVRNDVAPIIKDDRTVLPIRVIAEALGATVTWNEAEQSVTIAKGNTTIVIYINQPFAKVNSKPVLLNTPAFIEYNRTYLPLRFVAENLGANITWDAETQKVTIFPGE